jgi:hypothetical protein
MKAGVSRLGSMVPLIVAAFVLICSLTGASNFVSNPTPAMSQQELSDRVAALLTSSRGATWIRSL